MKRRGKIVLGIVGAVVVLVAVGAYAAYREFVGTVTFDAALYADTTNPAGAFSYDDYAAVLKKHVNDQGMVSYAALKADPTELDRFLRALAAVKRETYETWTDHEKIAFWVNAYNAITLKAIINHYPIKAGLIAGLAFPSNSIRQIPGVWDKLQWLVMGEKMTLNHIEHEVLRKEFNEPRIHVALVCAAIGCPPLRSQPFTGPRLDEQLNDQTKRFLANETKFRIDRDEKAVHLSSIFKWFGGDFIKTFGTDEKFKGHSDAERAVLNFISGYLVEADRTFLETADYTIRYLSYDWTLNEQQKGA